jgi:TonB family protein
MRRLPHTFCVCAVFTLLAFPIFAAAESDLDQHLRDEYQGKTLLLRGFYSSERLHYDSSGVPDNTDSGDWTVDGFVRVDDIHFSGDRLIVKGQRIAAVWSDRKQLELRPMERRASDKKDKEPVRLEIKADAGMHNPAPEQVDAMISQIFLTSKDSLADLVPEYWKPCVNLGLNGGNKNCVFAAEILAVPGAAVSKNNSAPSETSGDVSRRMTRIGHGVSPPRLTYQPEPEFSESARQAKYQGVVTLWLVVNKEGVPTDIRILQPLGYGLDAQAVKAVENWRFAPAEKDGQPVNVEIAVEVDFHLY